MTDPFYPVLVRQLTPAEGTGYVAQVLDLVGCMAEAETPEGALLKVQVAAADWLRNSERLGRAIPEPNAIVRRACEARSESSDRIKKQQDLIRTQAEKIKQQESLLRELYQKLTPGKVTTVQVAGRPPEKVYATG